MAKVDATIKVEVIKLYVFFPVAVWRAYGDLAVLTVFGVPVYRRIGVLVKILGIKLYGDVWVSTVSDKKPVLREKESKHAS